MIHPLASTKSQVCTSFTLQEGSEHHGAPSTTSHEVRTFVHQYLGEVSVQRMRFCLFSAIVFDGVKQVGFASVKGSISPHARDFR
jgi:hypothetical protein